MKKRKRDIKYFAIRYKRRKEKQQLYKYQRSGDERSVDMLGSEEKTGRYRTRL